MFRLPVVSQNFSFLKKGSVVQSFQESNLNFQFMEKFEGGGCIFRTGRCEDRARQEYEVKKQTEMEKLYRQMENMVEKEQKQGKTAVDLKQLACM